MDECTPVEVWQEYESQKRALDAQLVLRISEVHRQRDMHVQRIADELGCGVPQRMLTRAQAEAQARAVRRWRETSGCTG